MPLDTDTQRSRSAGAESITLPIAMWRGVLDEIDQLRSDNRDLVQHLLTEPIMRVPQPEMASSQRTGMVIPGG